MHSSLSRVLFSALFLSALASQAAPVGNLKPGGMVTSETVPGQIDITTDTGNLVQISLLTPSMFRVRAGKGGTLSDSGDKAAPIVLPHEYARVDFHVSDHADYQLIQTAALALRIYKKPLRLGLYQADNTSLYWQETQSLDLGDKSSYQTLSSSGDESFFGGGQQNGAYAFKGKMLEVSYSGGWEEGDRPSPAPFYMSSRGYGVLRNTWSEGSYDFRSNDYITTSHDEARFDAYYFAGASVHEVLAAYTDLTGRARILPRWAYEFGDSDCYNDADNIKKPGTVPDGWSDGPTGTTPDVIQSVAAKFRQYDMPGGWILPNDGYGCGYTNLPEVVTGLANYGFHTGLWTENGVKKIAWEVGTAGTRAQKLDVAWTGKGFQFSLDANMAAAQGILDNSDARPFVWTVMGWAGTQRYAVTWTGDQTGSWDYIRWHVPTLIGSGLSGQVYATGDVDGIFGGSPETYTRDLQWKSFTPVLMGMSGWSKNERKHPWWFEEPYRSINRDYLKLKMRLMPYMYTYAKIAEDTGAPIVRGLMWDHPKDVNANTETYKYQFFLGKDFLVAPVYRSQVASKGYRKGIYLPEGEWVDYWDGRVVDAPAAGKVLDYQVTLDRLPVFVRSGAIIPMYPSALYDGQVAKDVLTLDIYPHYPVGHEEFTLYEDDGITRSYQQGSFSQQKIVVEETLRDMRATLVQIGAVKGSFNGMETTRDYQLQIHSRAKPYTVLIENHPMKEVANRAEFDAATEAWYFDANEKYGVVHVKTGNVIVTNEHHILALFKGDAAERSKPTAGYPDAPAMGNAIPSDEIMVVNRPAEEPGHPLENAFDGKPDTWFRTVRDQSVKTGAHEFTLSLGERRMINGFELAPRNDGNWMYGLPREVEVYLGDSNGEWGTPVFKGALQKIGTRQKIEFAPKAGRLLRFRILSTWDQDDEKSSADPMVLASTVNTAYNSANIADVPPVTISEFAVLEYPAPNRAKQQVYLSGVVTHLAGISKDTANTTKHTNADNLMQMNGLRFRKGLGVQGNSDAEFNLNGDWQIFRADVGVDDACRAGGAVQFQIFGDDRLLFSSGLIKAPAVVKPEIDIRGVHKLSLLTVAGSKVCANWANASVLGFSGDTVVQEKTK